MTQIYVLSEAPLHNNPALWGDLARAAALPWVTGVVVQTHLADDVREDFDLLDRQLAAIPKDKLIYLANLPLPCPDGVPSVMIDGVEYPLTWGDEWIFTVADGVSYAASHVQKAGYTISGARILPSIASLTPCGAAVGWQTTAPGAVDAWRAAGWNDHAVLEAVGEITAEFTSILPGTVLSLPLFQPTANTQGLQAFGRHPVDFAGAVFGASLAQSDGCTLEAMDLCYDGTLNSFVSLWAQDAKTPPSVQLNTTKEAAALLAAAQAAAAAGFARIEIHQEQAPLLGQVFSGV